MQQELPTVICIYYKAGGKEGDQKWSSDVYDKADYPICTYDQFCKEIILTQVDMLRNKGYTVHHGFVSTLSEDDEKRSREYLERFA